MAVSGTKEQHREHHPPDPRGRHRSHHRTKQRAAYLQQTREAEGRGPARGRLACANLAAQFPRLPGSTPTLLDAMTDTGLPHLARCGNRLGEPNCAHFDRAAERGRRAFRYDGRGRTDPAAVEMGVLLIAQNRKFETHAATSRHVHHPHVLRERFCNGSALQATCTARRSCVPTTSRPSADGRSTPVPSWTWGIRSAMSVRL